MSDLLIEFTSASVQNCYDSNVNWPFVTLQWYINGDRIKSENRAETIIGEWENANDLACLYLTQRKNRSAFSSNTISHKLLLTYLTTLCSTQRRFFFFSFFCTNHSAQAHRENVIYIRYMPNDFVSFR